jgi:hypothetical protein
MASAASLLTESFGVRAWDVARPDLRILPPPPDLPPFVPAAGPTPPSDAEVELRLASLARARGPLRRALAAVAGRVVAACAHERLGFARLRDFAVERVGLSARSIQDLARVDGALARLPRLEAALVGGRLSWTKVRLLARVATSEDEAGWIEHAVGTSASELARDVRAVDRDALGSEPESDEDGVEEAARERIEISCRPVAGAKWFQARQAARRVAGEKLPTWGCVERLAAEVVSAVGLDPDFDGESGNLDEGARRREARREPANRCAVPPGEGEAGIRRASKVEGDGIVWHEDDLPPEVSRLLDGLRDADAFELDARLRSAVALEQGLDSEVGRLLRVVAGRRLFRLRGLASLEAYARERLGLSPRKARALLRLERAADRCPDIVEAYRDGRISWVQAHVIAPLVFLDGAPFWGAAWVERAEQVSVRRLEEDVDRALLVAESDPVSFQVGGGLPAYRDCDEACGCGSSANDFEAPQSAERQTGARPASDEETSRVSFSLPTDVARLFRAVLLTVRQRIEAATGRSATPGEAFEAMLDHALAAWQVRDPELRTDHRVYERDGWRCQFPGCSSLRNLHGHHIRFRSAGGDDDLSNLVTLCAWHHQRGVHARVVRVSGRAPERLRFELGVRREGRPLDVYRSGDVRVFE